MIEFILVSVIVIAFILFGVLIFIWFQMYSTDSRLVKLIEDRIRLNNVLYDLDRIEFPIVEEEWKNLGVWIKRRKLDMYMDEHTKKYELIDVGDDYIGNRKVYRIKALHDFESAKKGDLGGYVESEENLSHSGRCWVYDNAYVVDKARVYEDATIRDNVWIFDNAEVFGNAKVNGTACVYHHGRVYSNARLYDDAKVYNSAQAFGNAVVHGNARMKGIATASIPVTVVDNNKVVITITDDHIHVYQSKVYNKDNVPKKYRALLNLSRNIKE